MIGRTLSARTGPEVARLVRSLGGHRYVAGRLLLVHAFVLEALVAERPDAAWVQDVAEAKRWAREILADRTVDHGSKDERLWRRATERELGAALGVFWDDGADSLRARENLASLLRTIDAPVPESNAPLFDESLEDDVFPVLVDAGWELLPLSVLDAERHKGAIEAFGDALAFECAKFEEASDQNAPPPLQELSVLGPHELLHGAEHGILRAPFVLWTEGSETYHDYVLRGVLRAAKLD